MVTTLNSESKWERTVGWGWPTNLTKWLRKEGHFLQRRHFYKVVKRYSALSYTKAFGWSQKHFLVDSSYFFSFFFPNQFFAPCAASFCLFLAEVLYLFLLKKILGGLLSHMEVCINILLKTITIYLTY